MLIGAISAPLSGCFLENILEIFLEKTFKFFINFKKKYLYYFVKVFVKNLPKNVIFKVF